MSRARKKVPVMDYEAKHRLFHVTREAALDMIGRATAYLVTETPFTIALTNKPKNHRAQVDIDGMRPDRSLTVGASVVHSAALGIRDCVSIFNDARGWRSARFDNGPRREGQ